MISDGTGKLGQAKEYMARRRWVASCAELMALGISRSTIRGWLRAGWLVPQLYGVYSFGRDIETRESAWRAALLAGGPGSALTGRSACELWGLVRNDHAIPARIQVASASRKAVRLPGRSPALSRTRVEVVHRCFERGELRRRDGLDVTSPALALMDFAAEATPVAVKFAFLEACRLRLFRRRDLDYCYRRITGRRGARKLRPLLVLWVPELNRIRSVLEGLFILAWVAHGGPMPLINHKVHGYEVDCYWPDHGLVVELDGGAFHDDPMTRKRDAAKDADLRSRELVVKRFDYDDVNDNPGAVVGEVTRLLDRARGERDPGIDPYSAHCGISTVSR